MKLASCSVVKVLEILTSWSGGSHPYFVVLVDVCSNLKRKVFKCIRRMWKPENGFGACEKDPQCTGVASVSAMCYLASDALRRHLNHSDCVTVSVVTDNLSFSRHPITHTHLQML